VSHSLPRIAVATPYPEASIFAIARTAWRQGELSRLFTTLSPSEGSLQAIRWIPIPPLRRSIERDLLRRRSVGIPFDQITSVSTPAAMAHLASIRMPLVRDASGNLEHRLRTHFDRSVSRRLPSDRCEVVLSMYGSASETLARAREGGKRGVLNFVNSHPSFKNRHLRELGNLPDGHPEMVSEREQQEISRELENASLVLAPSRFVARQLEAVGVPRQNLVMEPYGVDLDMFRPRNGSARPSPDPIRCLYVGQILHRKGIPLLLDVARRLQRRPVEFLLIGPVRSREVLHDVPSNVRWRDSLTAEQVAEEMQGADIFVLPSIDDAFGLVTLEAMATGLPVIVSDHAGSSEDISDGNTGLVVPAGDGAQLQQAIERLIDDAALRRTLGAAARRHVEHGRSWTDYGCSVLQRLTPATADVAAAAGVTRG
jgi:glycosyltransferase involved in cell wall biosynthesis